MIEEAAPMTDRLPVGFVSEGGQRQAPSEVRAVVIPSDKPAALLDPLSRTMESEKTQRGHQAPGTNAPVSGIDATVIDQPGLGSTVFEEPSFSPDQLEAALSSPMAGAPSGRGPGAAPTAQMPQAQMPQAQMPMAQPHQTGGIPSPASQSVQLTIPKKSMAPLFIVLGALALAGIGVAVWALVL
jgi:hypothetical protein